MSSSPPRCVNTAVRPSSSPAMCVVPLGSQEHRPMYKPRWALKQCRRGRRRLCCSQSAEMLYYRSKQRGAVVQCTWKSTRGETMRRQAEPITVFCSYAPADETLRRELEIHLSPLQ